MTAIFIPTYHRANKLQALVQNIKEATPEGHKIYFIVEDDDTESKAVITALHEKYIINTGKPYYADCINTAYKKTTEPYFFTGADDLRFYPGWLAEAKKCLLRGALVVGTNDLHNPDVLLGQHATHYLVKRSYIDAEGGRMDATKGTVLYPYEHNYTDTEFICTATKRGVFLPCLKSKVEHIHWCWGLADKDETYEKGFRANSRDKEIFEKRRYLWER